MPLRPPTHEQLKRKARGEPERARYTEYDRLYARDRDPQLQRMRTSTRWRRMRRIKIARNPICEPCEREDRTTPTTQVHHLIPAATSPELFFVEDNLESVCDQCHALASARERRQ